MQSQIKVGDPVQIYGYGMSQHQENSEVGLFEGERAIVNNVNGRMIVVRMDDPDDRSVVEVHFFQCVPTKKDVLF